MAFLVLLVGIFILGTCLAFMFSPSLVEELITWLGVKRHLHYVAAIRLVAGAILLMGAQQTAYPQAITAIGILLIVAALVIVLFPAEKIKKITEYFLGRPTAIIRLWIMGPMLLGMFVVYSVI